MNVYNFLYLIVNINIINKYFDSSEQQSFFLFYLSNELILNP